MVNRKNVAQRYFCKIWPSSCVIRSEGNEVVHPHCDEFLRLKESAGWDNARAAQELALHPTVIWKYITGKTVPSLTVLRLLSGLTGQPMILVGESSPRFHDGPRWLEDWESDVITTLRRIEPEARKRVIRAITEMIDAIARGGPSYIRRAAQKPKSPLPTPAPVPDPIPSAEMLARELAGDIIDAASARRSAAGGAPDAGDPPPRRVADGEIPGDVRRADRRSTRRATGASGA